jgi:CrcB protein
MTWVAVAVGGAIGSVARYGATVWLVRYPVGRVFPSAVFLVNILGCLVIGLLAGGGASGRIVMGDTTRVFLMAGLLGGFTTFSTFGLDTHLLLRAGEMGPALLNVAGQVGLGLLAVWAGFALTGPR